MRANSRSARSPFDCVACSQPKPERFSAGKRQPQYSSVGSRQREGATWHLPDQMYGDVLAKLQVKVEISCGIGTEKQPLTLTGGRFCHSGENWLLAKQLGQTPAISHTIVGILHIKKVEILQRKLIPVYVGASSGPCSGRRKVIQSSVTSHIADKSQIVKFF